MADSATTLQFRVLGSLEVLDDGGELVGVRGLRRRALLLRLLIDANRVVPSDTLIEDVWSGRPPNDAVGTLQSHISLLRRLLGQRLHSRRPGYLLSVGEGELDARMFEAEVAQGRGLLERTEAVEAASILLETLNRWRGQPLLDVSGLPWAKPTTVHLEQLRFNAIELAAEALLLANRVDEAVALTRSAVEEEPLRERLWTHLMVGLARQGRQADALRAYQRARNHLAEQLGIEPSPPLLALEDAILMQRPIGPVWQPSATAHADPVLHVTIEEEPAGELEPVAGVGESDSTGFAVPERPSARSLVGRDRELTRVAGLMEAARSERRLRTLMVTGAPGMGRRRFAEEVARRARADGWEVFAMAFDAGGAGGDPFDLLAAELELDPGDLGDIHAREGALAAALIAVADRAPVCLIVGETQYGEPEHLAALRELIEQLKRLPVVVVFGALGLEFHQNRAMSTLFWRLHRQAGSEWIQLEGLEAEDLRDLVRVIDGTDLTMSEAERLRDLTGGNPMLAVEAVQWDGGDELGMQGLADLYTEQFADVAGEAVIDAATLVAVVGDVVPLELVAELRSRPLTEVIDDLEVAVRVGLLQDVGRGSYRVTVPLVGGLLLNRMSANRRAMLHREIADRLPVFSPEHGRRDVILAVADHWLAGARSQDARRLYEAAREAAEYSLGEDELEQAVIWLGIAQRLAEADPSLLGADRAELLYQLLHTRALLGFPFSLPLWRQAFAAAHATNDPELQANVVLSQPAPSWMPMERPLPLPPSTIEAVMASLPVEAMDLRARLLSHLASAEQHSWLTETSPVGAARRASVAVAREAVVSLRPASEPDTVLRVATVAASALHGPATLGSRAALLRRARRAARRAGGPASRADALLMELTTLTEIGDGAGAVAALERIEQLVESSDGPGMGCRDAVARAWRAVSVGDCEVAPRLLREVREHDPSPEKTALGPTYLLLSSVLQRQTGQIAAARAAVEALGFVFPGLASLRAERAAYTAWLGDLEEAVVLVEDAIDRSGEATEGGGWLSGRLFAAEVAIATEHHSLAARLVEELRPFDAQFDAGPIQLSRLAGSVPAHLGALLGLLGEHEEGEQYLRAAVELARALGSRYHEARARLRWATLLAARGGAGDRERSRELAGEVLALATDQPNWALRVRAQELSV